MHTHRISQPFLNNDAIIGDIPLLDKDFDPFELEADDIAGDDIKLAFDTDFDQ